MHAQSIFKINESKQKQEMITRVKVATKDELEKGRQKIMGSIEEAAIEQRRELIAQNPSLSIAEIDNILKQAKQEAMAIQFKKFEKNSESRIEEIVPQAFSSNSGSTATP